MSKNFSRHHNKLNHKRKFLLLGIFFMKIFSVSAQDPQFSQIFSDRIYLNPALVGTLECGELNLNAHNPYPQFGTAYKTISASFDSDFDKIGGGLGCEFLKDSQGNGTINTTEISLIYSYKLKLNQKFNLNFGFETTWNQRKIDTEKLIFSNMIDPNTGIISPISTENLENQVQTNFDFSTGAALYSKKIFSGISVFHVVSNNKNQSSALSPRVMIYFGKKININKFENENNFTILAPFVAYKQQAEEKQFFYGTFIEKKIISAGIMLCQNLILHRISPVFTFEIKYFKFRLSYSYEINLTKYYTAPTYSNEISISYELICRKKNEKRNTIFCPHY
jgi:type IX secretion system PorP/SprF family membrane protein